MLYKNYFTSLKLYKRLFSSFSKHLHVCVPCAIFFDYPSCFMHEKRLDFES